MNCLNGPIFSSRPAVTWGEPVVAGEVLRELMVDCVNQFQLDIAQPSIRDAVTIVFYLVAPCVTSGNDVLLLKPRLSFFFSF